MLPQKGNITPEEPQNDLFHNVTLTKDKGKGKETEPKDIEMDGGGASGSSAIATQPPSITDIEGWNTEQLIQYLQSKFPDKLKETALDILREQEIEGISFLKLTEEKLEKYGMKGGPAAVILSYIDDLKGDGPAEPSHKKARLDIEDAVNQAKLANKAVVGDLINLSLLNDKERVAVLGLLGGKVYHELDSFNILLQTARTIQNKLKSDEGFPETISTPSSNMKFPVVDRWNLYVRKAYKDLYNHIARTFKDTQTDSRRKLLVIMGTSGIGKSAFLIYFIIRLIAESSGDNPPIVIFHTKEGSKCYAFGGTSTLRVGSIADFEDFLVLPNTWYLMDSSPEPVVVEAKTLIAASPKTYHSEGSKYQVVSKESASIYYMAPWKLDELNKCRLSVFPDLPEDCMERLYARMGGVPRYVLKGPVQSLAWDPEDSTLAEKDAFSRVQMSIDGVENASKLLEYMALAKDSLEFSSRLLHRWPKDNHRDFFLAWASTHILEEIEKKLTEQSWAEVLKALVRTDQLERGILYELYVIHIFRKGGHTFEIRNLEGNLPSDQLSIPSNPPVQHFKTSAELSEPTDGTLYVPTNYS